MTLAPLDWLFVAVYFVFSFGIALYYFKRAGKNTSEFFLSGRNMPWWLAGTSMVATTFAADTPLAVTELVAQNGIAGNWLWWNMVFGGMLAVFFFARLWRRSGVMTDVEFVELRYSGPAAAALRGIKAVFFGLILNSIILGWVCLAMETVLKVLFPGVTFMGAESFGFLGFEFSAAMAWVGILMLVVAGYSLLAGLWGVMVTDLFQFAVAMTATVVLAYFALSEPEVGGVAGLMDKLPATTFNLMPSFGDAASGAGVLTLSALSFIAYVGVQWWSAWYPGSEPGGGGYIAQRMMSAKDEKNALFATLWFNVAHYCLRPWPWILTALAALVMYPGLEDPREGFVMIMRDVLPTGFLGLLFAAFLAAFMSTLSTQLNWGVSYLVNDFWRRFVKTDGSEKYYVGIARLFTFLLAVITLFVATSLDSISGAWGLILSASAGLGAVLILRWYWWRVNAWSELVATVVPITLVALSLLGLDVPFLTADFPNNLFGVTAISTVCWLAATFLTKPTDARVLDTFYRRVRPGGPGWETVAQRHPDIEADSGLGALALDWLAGVALVYSILLGVGNLIFGRTGTGLICLTIAALAIAFLAVHLDRSDDKVTE